MRGATLSRRRNFGGGQPQVQGKPLTRFTTTDPDHVFEIHPIAQIDSIDTCASLHPIAGFTTKDDETAFTTSENIWCTITPSKTTTKLTTSMAGYNYVEFIMELVSDPVALPDGNKVFASIHNLADDLLVHKRRMIFISGTPPAAALVNHHQGDQLHVLGIPRINLALVAWRTAHAKRQPEVLSWNLPYEIIIVGVYELAA